MKYDVITFGSATYDTYLTSEEFELHRERDGVMLCEMYGKKVEIDECVVTSGGGATNAAVCFERMGLQSAVIACLGNDYWGRIVKAQLAEEGVSLIHMQSTDKKPTSSSVVLVGRDGGRTILVYRAASNLLSWHKVAWQNLSPRWFYVSSLGGDFTLLTKIIRTSQEKQIKIAFNPGGQELEAVEKIKPLLPYIDVLLMNKQEAMMLLHTTKPVLSKEKVYGLGAKVCVITNGRKGATAYTSNGSTFRQKVIPAQTVEETGAGDAFGSGFVAAQIHGFSILESLYIGALNASSVVEYVGPKKGLLFWPDVLKNLGHTTSTSYL